MVDEERYNQLRTFFVEEVLAEQPDNDKLAAIYDLMGSSRDGERTTVTLGKPHGDHVMFYDYTPDLPTVSPDPVKAPFLQWTHKHTTLKTISTEYRDPEQNMDIVKETIKGWLTERYRLPNPQEVILQAGRDLVIRGHEQQLRLTFLEGNTIHGHAYFEPLNTSVSLTPAA